MTDVKRLLDEATPLPWVVQEPGENDPGAGTVFIDTHAYEDGPEPVIAEPYPLGRSDAALIVYAVNHLPDYEALADAAESCLREWDTLGPTGTQDTITEHASLRAALRRLRGES